MSSLQWRARITAAVGTGVLLAAASVVLAGPANAMSNMTVVTVSSPNNVTDAKSITASCPAGRKVIGAGGETTDGSALLEGVVPTATSVTAYGREDEGGVAGTWRVVARAVCADDPGGHAIVEEAGATNAGSKGEEAFCPAGKETLGTGFRIVGGSGQVGLTRLDPDGDSVEAYGTVDDTGYAGFWEMRAYAICSVPVADREFVTNSRYVSSLSEPVKSELAVCPPGKRSTGGGAEIDNGGNDVAIHALTPTFLSIVSEEIFNVKATEYVNGTSNNWKIDVESICVNG